jgi:hypothetical protein
MKIRVILEDAQGQERERIFRWEGDLDHLDGIDKAVEQFKTQALPEIECALFAAAQSRDVKQKKGSAAMEPSGSPCAPVMVNGA